MRKWTVAAVILGAVLGLGQCSLFSHQVKYIVDSSPSGVAVSILYNDAGGEGVIVQTSTPWTETLTVYPTAGFVAAIRVTNNGVGPAVTTEITVDNTVQGSGSCAPGATTELFYWVD